MLTLRRAAVALLTIVAFAAAGCGSSDDDGKTRLATFKKAYAVQSLEIKAVGEGVGAAIGEASEQTDEELQRTFGDLGTRARGSARSLAALDPPDEAKAETEKLTGALNTAADGLEAIVAAAKAGDADAARVATQKLVADSVPIRDARAALDKFVKG